MSGSTCSPRGAVIFPITRTPSARCPRSLPVCRKGFRPPSGIPSGRPEEIPWRRNVFRLSPQSLPDFFRDRIEAFGPADALRRVRKKITGTLTGRVEFRDGLIEVHAYSAYQPGSVVQLPEYFTQRRAVGCGLAPQGRHGELGRVGTPGAPGPAGRLFQQLKFLVVQAELDFVAPGPVPGSPRPLRGAAARLADGYLSHTRTP